MAKETGGRQFHGKVLVEGDPHDSWLVGIGPGIEIGGKRVNGANRILVDPRGGCGRRGIGEVGEAAQFPVGANG